MTTPEDTGRASDEDVCTSPYSAVRAVARDRRHSAVHEAAHFVIARWSGLRFAEAWIYPVEDAAPGDPAWRGQCQFVGRDRRRLSDFRNCMIAVEGSAGECVWDAGDSGDDDAFFFMFERMSETDCEDLGLNPGDETPRLNRAADKVITLLRGELRAEWLAAARRLIVEHQVRFGRAVRNRRGILRATLAPHPYATTTD
jgi:hypothetical protein